MIDGERLIVIHFEEGDPENPMNWSKRQKWVITFLLCMMTTMVGLSTSAYSSGVAKMSKEFGVANVVGQIGMFTFNAACAVAPLFLAPFCEFVGRREVFLIGYGCFVLVFLLLALGKNIGSEIVGRLLSGLFGSAGTILVGGTLADIWNTKERGLPMSCFTFVAIFGTIAAPTYCGYIDKYAGWRRIESARLQVHMIACGVLFVAEVLFLKETRGAKILTQRAKKLRKETGDLSIRSPSEVETKSVKELLKKSTTRAVVLMYISLIIGCFIGFATGFWADKKYDDVREANGGVPIPEYRLWVKIRENSKYAVFEQGEKPVKVEHISEKIQHHSDV
ncbi:hypothetical protein RQP46_005120 [Phenoliferia psychrophenolica]